MVRPLDVTTTRLTESTLMTLRVLSCGNRELNPITNPGVLIAITSRKTANV